MRGLVAQADIPAGEVIGKYLGYMDLFGSPCKNGPVTDAYRMHLRTRTAGNKFMASTPWNLRRILHIYLQQGRQQGYQKYSAKEELLLCDLSVKPLPTGRNMCMALAAEYNGYKGSNLRLRDFDSLRMKFRKLRKLLNNSNAWSSESGMDPHDRERVDAQLQGDEDTGEGPQQAELEGRAQHGDDRTERAGRGPCGDERTELAGHSPRGGEHAERARRGPRSDERVDRAGRFRHDRRDDHRTELEERDRYAVRAPASEKWYDRVTFDGSRDVSRVLFTSSAMAAAATPTGLETVDSNNAALSSFIANAWYKHSDNLRLVIYEDSDRPLRELDRAINKLCSIAGHQGIVEPTQLRSTSELKSEYKSAKVASNHARPTPGKRRVNFKNEDSFKRRDFSKAKCDTCGELGHTTGYDDKYFHLKQRGLAKAARASTSKSSSEPDADDAKEEDESFESSD
ncbi:unnamed protein product [Phytophthora fragariaefolia]|uniref:Unnamed protein product n=1 Tax=Phytophthora fragariaefolia TaxID=1490495 RepID=A0A9W6YCH7_9STRA|nr:unnamed protein product [Phytophthora fragariaefolia]